MKHYHNISISQVAQALKTDTRNGLTSNEAKKRLERNGTNTINEKKRKSIIVSFFAQFNDFMILLLIGAAIISYITSIISKNPDIVEPIIILAIVTINAILGVTQESRAQKSIDALKKLSAPKARVIRDGKEITIDSSQIVCGDILVFNTGDIVCADCRLIECNSLLLGEASLTGEAVPRAKNADKILPEFTPLGDRINMVFSSTGVVGGNGKGVVVKTGMATEVGEIASMLLTEDTPQTPLQKKLNNTGKVLGTSALLICVAIFIIGIFSHLDPLDMFMTSVSLAVAAIPEGLPAIVTIMLAIGVVKMSGKNAIVRTLPSVETLGSASVICTDKTGTLTKNEMKVTTHYTDDTQTLLSLCALCSSKNTNPTDSAIFTWASENIKDIDTHIKKHKIIKEIPFSSDSKKMSVLCSYLGKNKVITKGAVEYILPQCTSVLKGKKTIPLSPQERKTILNRNENMTSNALRVIAVAYCDTASNEIKEENMVFVGLIGIEDPPRPEARNAVLKCKNAGIIPVMITGDNVGTAVSIAKKTGILDNEKVMVGCEIDKLSDDELKKCVREYRVFARVSPTHKVRIVKAWQSNGAVVAMTGDGVNDAPALSNADIGCSMGKSGTEVAKNASDIILADDNFATIVGAVEVGRSIFDNIKKSVKFLLSSNIGEILTVFSGIVFGYSSPLNAISLLWVNLVTDSLPAIALGLDPDDDNIMSRPPSKAKNSLFSVPMWRDIILQGLMIGALSLLAFSIGTNVFGNILVGRTMAFAVLSLSQLIHAFNMRSDDSVIKAGLFKNKYLILSFLVGVILEVGVISIEPVARIFDITPLSPIHWVITAILSFMPLLIVETGKILEKKD